MIYTDIPEKDIRICNERTTLEAYIEWLEKKVVCCSDVLPFVIHDGEVNLVLPTRKHEPGEGGPWLIGGQSFRGESAIRTAYNRFHEDVNSTIDINRLDLLASPVDIYWSYCPEYNGHRHDRTSVYGLELIAGESEMFVRRGVKNGKEYESDSGFKLWNEEGLRQHLESIQENHPRHLLLKLLRMISQKPRLNTIDLSGLVSATA